MRVLIEAKTSKGQHAINDMFQKKTFKLPMLGGHAEITNKEPLTLEISQRDWKRLSAQQANSLFVYAPFSKIISKQYDLIEEVDFNIRCV